MAIGKGPEKNDPAPSPSPDIGAKEPRNYRQLQSQLDEAAQLRLVARSDQEKEDTTNDFIRLCEENRDIVGRPHPKQKARRAEFNTKYADALIDRVRDKTGQGAGDQWDFSPYHLRSDRDIRAVEEDLYQASQAALMVSSDVGTGPVLGKEIWPGWFGARTLVDSTQEAYDTFKEYKANIESSQSGLEAKMDSFLTDQFGAGNYEVTFYNAREGEIMVAIDGELPQTANFQIDYFNNGSTIGAGNFDLSGQSEEFPFTEREFLDSTDW